MHDVSGSYHAALGLELNLQTLHGASDLGELALGRLDRQGAGRNLAVEFVGLEIKKIIRNIVSRIKDIIGKSSLLL